MQHLITLLNQLANYGWQVALAVLPVLVQKYFDDRDHR